MKKKKHNSLFLVQGFEEAIEVAREYLKVQPGTDFDIQYEMPDHCGVKHPLWMRVSKDGDRAARLDFFTDEQVHNQLAQASPDYESLVTFERPSASYKSLKGGLFAVRDAGGLRAAAIAYCTMCHDDHKSVTIEEEWQTEDKFPCVVSFRAIGHGTVVINDVMRRKDLKRAIKALDKWDF
jgi:hypothetical protein